MEGNVRQLARQVSQIDGKNADGFLENSSCQDKGIILNRLPPEYHRIRQTHFER